MTGTFAGWGEMVLALGVFFATHSVPARPNVRRALNARLGTPLYMALYSLVSLAVLVWLVVAAGRAPYVEIWSFEPWQLWAPNAVMPLVCLILSLGVAAPNPFSIAGRNGDAFDPAHPGIAGVTRHPVLWGLTLWAIAHVIPNGDLAHVILFGLFAAFGIAGMVVLDRRSQRTMGPALWAERSAHTSLIPFAAIVAGRAELTSLRVTPVRGLAALCVYLTFLALHQITIGVSPLPMLP